MSRCSGNEKWTRAGASAALKHSYICRKPALGLPLIRWLDAVRGTPEVFTQLVAYDLADGHTLRIREPIDDDADVGSCAIAAVPLRYPEAVGTSSNKRANRASSTSRPSLTLLVPRIGGLPDGARWDANRKLPEG
jgi:hypothetical protein